jgi:TP901 family phage tail tape measure protein
MSDAVLQTTIKAFDEFTASFQKFQKELKKTEQAENDTVQGTDKMNKSVTNLFTVLGQLGTLYAFQRGLREVMGTGREFELVIKQAQAVTGDFSATLRDLAMATKGGNLDMFGPTQLAQAYRELGAAGADVNDIIASTPNILEFGTAALLDTEKAAYGVLAAAKSFNIELTDSKQIVDAYTESMNLGALAGEDFQWIMGSAGAVAKMAGQDFREILSVGSAMRDSGIQAQDAGTAIKSALMQLMNPSTEARKLMDDLDISIYDASGKMKQWSDITAEFERVLSGYNEQSQQFILGTIFGTDGIRAMAISMNKGSDYLKDFTAGLKNADGATHQMASAMADTLDGSIRKVNTSMEKLKIEIFEDIEPLAVDFLNGILAVVEGFNSMDETGQRLIETLIGSGGIGAAILTLIALFNKLKVAILGAEALAGPPGWVIAAISLGISGLIQLAGAQKASAEAQETMNQKYTEWQQLVQSGVTAKNAADTVKQVDEINNLINKYDSLIAKRTELNNALDSNVLDDAKQIADYKSLRETEDGLDEVTKRLQELGLTIQQAKELRNELNKTAEKGRALMTDESQALAQNAVETKKAADAKLELIQRYLELSEGVKNQADIAKLSSTRQKELANVVSQLAGFYPDLVTQIDEHGNAVLFENKALASQIPIIQELSSSSISEARTRIEQERSKSATVIAETRKRLEVLMEEKRALLAAADIDNGNSSMTEREKQVRRASKFIWLGSEIKEATDTLSEHEKAIVSFNRALNNIDNSGSGDTSGDNTWTAPTGSGGSKNQASAAAKSYADAVNEALRPYKAAVDAAANSVGLLSVKEQYLAQVMESGNGTINDAVELNKVRAMQYGQLTQQQEALHKQAEAERLALVELQNSFANATNADAAKELRNEIDNLTQSIAQSSQAWWQAEQQKLTVLSQSKAAEEQRYQDAYQKATALMRHQVNMAGMSTAQQISYLTKLKNAHQWTTQQTWDLEEQIYSLRKKQLSDYLSDLETDYKAALDKIDAKTKSTVEQLRAKIDALNEDNTEAEREEATYQHSKKIADLQKERQYHELRTGKEHAQAIADIDEQIAEENRKYQLTQEKWIREDKKASYEQQIEDAEEAGQEERDRLEDHYNRVMSIMNNGAIDTLAVLSAKDSAFQAVAVNWMQSLMTGIESKEPEFLAKISKLLKQLDAYESEVSSSSSSSASSAIGEVEQAGALKSWYKNEIAYLTQLKQTGTSGEKEWANQALYLLNLLQNGNSGQKTWAEEQAAAIGLNIPSYDKGGYIFYDQVAQVHKGEYVLPASVVEAIRLMNPPPSSPSSDQSNGGTVIHNEQYFNAPLVGIEKQYLNDDTTVMYWPGMP